MLYTYCVSEKRDNQNEDADWGQRREKPCVLVSAFDAAPGVAARVAMSGGRGRGDAEWRPRQAMPTLDTRQPPAAAPSQPGVAGPRAASVLDFVFEP